MTENSQTALDEWLFEKSDDCGCGGGANYAERIRELEADKQRVRDVCADDDLILTTGKNPALPFVEVAQVLAALDPPAEGSGGPTCGSCRRQRVIGNPSHPMDAYDYSPLQVVTGQRLGWYSGDDGEICPECMTRILRDQ